MNTREFVDYYELLQVSPNAETETIERMFRHLAKKTHPDSSATPDDGRFQKIVEAHRVLTDPESRASYDARYQDFWNHKWKIAAEAGDSSTFGNDHLARERMLSLLYVQRRRTMKEPGLGMITIGRLLGLPMEMVEFHMWYLRAKEWVERIETGQMAITALGVDQVEQGKLRVMPDHLLEAHMHVGKEAEEGEKSIKREELLTDT